MISATGHVESQYGRDALRYCRKNGIKIAIATAQPSSTFFNASQRAFLYGLGIRKTDVQLCIGKDAVYDANGSLKGPMLQEILKIQSVDPSSVLFIDDQPGNLVTGQMLGMKVQLCNKENVGLTETEFFEGLSKVDGKPALIIFDLDYSLTRPNMEMEEGEYYEPSFRAEVSPYLMGGLVVYLLLIMIYRVYKA